MDRLQANLPEHCRWTFCIKFVAKKKPAKCENLRKILY